MLPGGLHKDLSGKEAVVEKGGHRNAHISAIYQDLGLQLPLQPKMQAEWQVPPCTVPRVGRGNLPHTPSSSAPSCWHTKRQSPALSWPRPFLRVVFAVSNPEGWDNIFPQTKNRLVTTHYRSGEFPRLKFLSFHGSPLYGQASPIMGCIYPNRTWGHGSQHEANTKLWLRLLPWVMKYSVSNLRVSCLLLASLKQ